MLVRNYDALASNDERRDALAIMNAGLEAIQAEGVMQHLVSYSEGVMRIHDREFDLDQYGRVFVVGIGKSACEVVQQIEKILGDKITQGVVLGTHQGKHGRVECMVTTHPMPSEQNIAATGKMLAMLAQAEASDLVLMVITGGGSAMMCQPVSLSSEELIKITQALFRVGASIDEINTIRKHLSQVKGGWLVTKMQGARVAGLIFSDVEGDDLSVIASGPTVIDQSTVADAQAILSKYNIWQESGVERIELTETPKDPAQFAKVDNILLVNKDYALKQMAAKAKELGYMTDIKQEYVKGEARDVGKGLLAELTAGKVIVAGGETTVHVTGKGRGGRNQELVLGALESLKLGQVITSVASDGIDLTKYAGAIGDMETIKKMKEKNISAAPYLTDNNATEFWTRVDDGIETGKLALNVADLLVVLQRKE